jgi:hypothetical protein
MIDRVNGIDRRVQALINDFGADFTSYDLCTSSPVPPPSADMPNQATPRVLVVTCKHWGGDQLTHSDANFSALLCADLLEHRRRQATSGLHRLHHGLLLLAPLLRARLDS